MFKPLKFRSREEQRAVFSRLSYSEFNRKTDRDYKTLIKNRLNKESFSDFNKRSDIEFKKDIPHTFKDILFTDNTLDVKHTIYGADVPYDKFWYEVDLTKKNEFSNDEDDEDDDLNRGLYSTLFSEK
jgi:hypothetical protein